jgi:hypothetical protein
MSQATCYKTVAAWNMTDRQFEGFPHPNPYVQCRKCPLPRLLEVYPDAKDQIASFAIKNLAKLTIEGVHNFIVSKVIPLWKRRHYFVLNYSYCCHWKSHNSKNKHNSR